jgi:hypothetical protein
MPAAHRQQRHATLKGLYKFVIWPCVILKVIKKHYAAGMQAFFHSELSTSSKCAGLL